MSIKLGDNGNKYILKWDGDNEQLRLLTYGISSWNATYSQYDSVLQSTKILSYKTPFLYGYDTTTQTNLGATYANVMSYNTIIATQSISIVDGSKITFHEKGLYNIQFSAQMDKTDAGDDDVHIWFRKNNTNITYSNSQLTLHGNNAKALPSWNFFEEVNEGDYIEICWHSTDADMRILAASAQSNPARPGIPSVILTVSKIGGIWEI